jgi:predicted HTH domain antitoxin
MTVTIPDGLKLTEGEALLNMAVGLVSAGKITAGRGALMCGMEKEDFRGILKERRIETYGVNEFREDIQTLGLAKD